MDGFVVFDGLFQDPKQIFSEIRNIAMEHRYTSLYVHYNAASTKCNKGFGLEYRKVLSGKEEDIAG